MSDTSGNSDYAIETLRWEGTKRRDGSVFLRAEPDGTLTIVPSDGRPSIRRCPCCERIFFSPRAASLAADAIYPPAPGNQRAEP